MTRSSLEKQRMARVAKAEQKLGMREGVYILPGNEPPHVRLSVNFYPKERWYIEDVNILGGAAVKGTARPLTDEIKAKLESWL